MQPASSLPSTARSSMTLSKDFPRHTRRVRFAEQGSRCSLFKIIRVVAYFLGFSRCAVTAQRPLEEAVVWVPPQRIPPATGIVDQIMETTFQHFEKTWGLKVEDRVRLQVNATVGSEMRNAINERIASQNIVDDTAPSDEIILESFRVAEWFMMSLDNAIVSLLDTNREIQPPAKALRFNPQIAKILYNNPALREIATKQLDFTVDRLQEKLRTTISSVTRARIHTEIVPHILNELQNNLAKFLAPLQTSTIFEETVSGKIERTKFREQEMISDRALLARITAIMQPEKLEF